MRKRGVRKKLVGVVVSNRMDKTVVVLVNRMKKHSMYKKYITTRSKFVAHDPENRCQTGDKVRIQESRPISKTKRWQVMELIERAQDRGPGAEEVVYTEQAE
ncbi:MAG: 30S ribosomal protein S17 [Deltaproteobacteria bacterium]|nr:30S ribosomal protein S17 [Deltaproteobacteria bacterium]